MKPPRDSAEALGSAPRLSISDAGLDPSPVTAALPGRAERYRRGALLGVGGMGRVHLAQDTWLGRQVAMKEIAHVAEPGARQQLRDRLRGEARLAARLEHPAIVPIYDVDEAADGSVFYVMRVVRGRSLAMALAAGEVGRERDRWLRAMLTVIEAVAYAHHAGVVHRDLKPANLMLGEFGEAQVLDWGLAVAVDSEGFAPSRGAGTQGYMSPEQARGEDVDARSDVWSLGTILSEIVRASEGDEVELAAIVRQACAAQRDARYADAKALATDLAAWLDGRRVRAHSYSTWQLFMRVVRAWRVPIAIGLAALVAIGVAIGLGAAATERERERAVQAEAEARKAATELASALSEASKNLAQALLGEARTRARAGARPEAEVLAARSLALFDDPRTRGVLASFGASPRPTRLSSTPLPPGCGGVSIASDGTFIVCRYSDRLERWQLAPLTRRWVYPVEAQAPASLLADDSVLVSAPERVLVIDGGTGATVTERIADQAYKRWHVAPHVAGLVGPWSVVWANRESAIEVEQLCLERAPVVVAAVTQPALVGTRWYWLCADGELRAGRLGGPTTEAGRATGIQGAAAMVYAAGDPATLIVGTNDGRLVWVEADTGRVLETIDTGLSPILDVQLSPDARIVAVRGERGGVALYDHWTRASLDRLPADRHEALRFVGTRCLVVVGDHVELWDLPEPLPSRLDLPGGVTSIVLAERDAGPGVMSIGADAMVEHWQWPPRTATARSRAQWQTGTVKSLTASDDAIYVSAVGELGVRALPLAPLPEPGPLADFGAYRARRVGWLRAAPEGTYDGWLVLLEYEYAVVAVPLQHGRGVVARPLAEADDRWLAGSAGRLGEHMDLAVAPGARHMALLSEREGLVRRVVARPDVVVVDREIGVDETGAVALERDGEIVWTTGDERVAARSFEDGRLIAATSVPGARFVELAVSDFDATGRWVAAGARDGQTWVWRFDGERLALAFQFSDQVERIAALTFSRDGNTLATGSWDRSVRLRALGTPPDAVTLEALWGVDLERALR